MKTPLSTAVLALCAGAAVAQTATMPPHNNVFTGNTRGYWFTAPVSFRITGVQALQNPGTSNAFMNWAIIRFDGNVPPPVFSATTNAFTHLGLGLDHPAGAYSPVSIDIFAGDVIGIYGNTMAAAGGPNGANSYSPPASPATTTIFGNVVALGRSGMQFHLGSATSPGGMHDVWQEPTSTQISRTEFTYTEIPAPASLALLGLGGLVAARRRR
jgi:hypothetical protein